ncbi:MAG: Ig-like domain-containing protein [Clostridia bacterium]|nr:Ig-like domain-containing protein [Clostridia bacterium]
MRKRIISLIAAVTMLASLSGAFTVSANAADEKAPSYQTTARIMEDIDRGLIAIYHEGVGVYLSWRLLGKESLSNQAFDIYRSSDGTNFVKIVSTGAHDATNYLDQTGQATYQYKVVPKGKKSELDAQKAVSANVFTADWTTDKTYAYMDIPISMPTDIPHANTTAMSDYTRKAISGSGNVGGANDASVGDLDGDGEYEIVLKWDPNDSKDSSHSTTTGHCVFDAYEIDPNNDGYMWRIDIGNNIAAGAHYSQFMVYDFDNNGKAEIATITAPGSYSLVKNAEGGYDKIYVTTVGDTEEIRNADNSATTLRKGNNNGPEYYTIFDGETGRPLVTTDAIPLGKEDGSEWGDAKMNRSSRYLAAVAYLDGVNPYYVPVRGMYNRTVLRAYTWDGENLTLVKEHDGNKKGETLYGQGNHNLSVADIDNDGKDEIVYGSACLDDDFETVLGNTLMGHGDAMHVSDFNNDGKIEVFSVKEDSEGNSRAADFRVAETGAAIWSKSVKADNGRGFMANICDAYAAAHPEALSLGFSSATTDVYDFNGDSVGVKPSTSRSMINFGVYWDGDLSRELYEDNIMGRYTYNTSTGKIEFGRIFFGNSSYLPASSNNSTKYNACLVADLFGDWREELIMAVDDTTATAPKLRIFTSVEPTEYRLTTLMHDCQYREAIAWQNVGYNQPPHTSYYIGSAALATDSSGNKLNYLAPTMPFTTVIYPDDVETVNVTGLTLTDKNVRIEKGKTETLTAVLAPAGATKRGITWVSSNPNVATVTNGIVKAVSEGTAKITATSRDTTNGTFSDTCNVTVYSNPITDITLSEEELDVGMGYEKTLKATVLPDDASDKTVTWTSADESIATVDADGVVKGVNYGKTVITATASDGVHKAQCTVTVKPIMAVDATGSDVFVSTTNNSDSGFSGSATGATLNLSKFASASELHKDFTPYNDNKATITLNFYKGGQKEDSKYIWLAGHEYNAGLKFLDTEGNVILDIYDANKNTSGTGVTTMYKLSDGEAKNASGWTKIADGDSSPFGRSAIRWKVTLEFDYLNDLCTATVGGCADSNFTPDATYQTTFSLNGASFKTLQYYTGDLTDYITQNTTISGVSYLYETSAEGDAELLYERGTYDKPWSAADIAEWVQSPAPQSDGDPTLVYDSTNGRIWYNPTKPGVSYSATKTVNGILNDAIISYDADWHFGLSVGRDGNYEYIQFGNKLLVGWTNGYKTYVSTDGGTTWGTTSIFDGSNTEFTKNIKVEVDAKTKKIKSFTFDGNRISAYEGVSLGDDAAFNSVSLGFSRAGAPPDWAVPNGIDRIRVSQFIPETTPASGKIANLTLVSAADKTVTASYALSDNTATGSALIIGALYDGNKLVEMRKARVVDVTESVSENIPITFDNTVTDYTVKLMMWGNMKTIEPLADAVTRNK